MKIIKNKWFPFGNYSTINLFGVLFTKQDKLSERTINHELIHTEQMKEMLYIPFYLWYGIEYVILRLCRLFDEQNEVYHDVSFEEEACNNQDKLYYLNTRSHFAWLKYLGVHSNEKNR